MPPDATLAILKVRNHLGRLNEQIDYTNKFVDGTFSATTAENHALLDKNATDSYIAFASMARLATDDIEKAILSLTR